MKLRINETKEPLYPFPFSTSKDVYEKMKEYSKADREMFMVMYLSAGNQVIDCELHSVGAVNTSAVYPREVFRGALLANACAIICLHNHPSGEVNPSTQDDQITKELIKAGMLLQVDVLDHVIIGAEGYFSYADDGRIGDYEQEAGKSPCQGHVAEGNNKTCTLIKKFKGWPDKIVYQGTLRGAKKRIPPSKKEQYQITFKR